MGVAFQISLHVKDKEILKEIESFFDEAGIGSNKVGINKWTFVVASLKDLMRIVEHFDNYPLLTQKYGDYLLFREVIMLMQGKEHLTREGLGKNCSNKSVYEFRFIQKIASCIS